MQNILPLGFMWIDTIVMCISVKLFNFLKNSGLANFGIIILLLTLIIKFYFNLLPINHIYLKLKMKVLSLR